MDLNEALGSGGHDVFPNDIGHIVWRQTININFMGDKPIVELGVSGSHEGVMVVAKNMSRGSSVHVENSVSIGVFEEAALAPFEVHVLLACLVLEASTAKGLKMVGAWELGHDSNGSWVVGELEPEEL